MLFLAMAEFEVRPRSVATKKKIQMIIIVISCNNNTTILIKLITIMIVNTNYR